MVRTSKRLNGVTDVIDEYNGFLHFTVDEFARIVKYGVNQEA